jgi:glycosyltransferase involved in cell wall biosynthesis
VGKLLDDAALRMRLAAAGREAAQSRFTWPVLAKEVAGVYRELLKR